MRRQFHDDPDTIRCDVYLNSLYLGTAAQGTEDGLWYVQSFPFPEGYKTLDEAEKAIAQAMAVYFQAIKAIGAAEALRSYYSKIPVAV